MILNFQDYISQAKLTAIYPKKSAKIYLLAGLLSELGEVSGVIKKHIRDSGEQESLRLKIKAELGDSFWCATRLG
mgnify:CR=1 FL=1